MTNQQVDHSKRRFLVAATSAMGGVATVAVAAPLFISWLPSERAKAAGAPVEVDIGKIEPGAMIIVEWRSKPVWIINRTKEMIDSLSKVTDKLADAGMEVPQQPDYCKNATRSIKPEIMVLIGVCTHLGCSPSSRLKAGAESGLGADWLGGFFCVCHGSPFDVAGRVFKGAPAPTNLEVPKHKYLSDTRLLIGEDEKGA